MSDSPILFPSRPLRVYDPNVIRRKNPETWRLQYKWGGHHMVVCTHQDGHMFSRHGKPLSSAAKTDFSNLCARVFGMDSVLDGELVIPNKETGKPPWFVIWDMPVHQGRDLTQQMYITRLAILAGYWTDFKEMGRIRVYDNLWIAQQSTLASLDGMLQQCDGKLLEGVVAKNLAHNLSWSRVAQVETVDQLKFRVEDLRPPRRPPLHIA